MKNFLYVLIFFWATPHSFAQLNLVQFEQIDSLQKIEKRNLVVFIHTDWCKYCQVMKSKTFKNEKVIKEINKHFYFVDFNAEEKRKIIFNNFNFKPNRNSSGIHEIAIQLGTINNQITYPTLCVLNEKNEIVFQYSGFLNAKDLLGILEKIRE